ncbi:MAG TPA: hypothetical protein PKD85_02925 [Saprospiraceae bacterium]|nr:hypothetical protein [Saprospiraceae bacterium]
MEILNYQNLVNISGGHPCDTNESRVSLYLGAVAAGTIFGGPLGFLGAAALSSTYLLIRCEVIGY